ncbi:hypothetical protein BaRGS_00008799 [Batillaria attramentaria]|uniref:Uncharacterized protein n=1 Tax=Batillaria attramentaria TaxID=370345 RepID=A0ABD0LL29_9CAEN
MAWKGFILVFVLVCSIQMLAAKHVDVRADSSSCDPECTADECCTRLATPGGLYIHMCLEKARLLDANANCP